MAAAEEGGGGGGGGGGGESERESPAYRLREAVEDRWRRTVKHAETYPYVWGTYILVYGGLSAYLTYKWTKLRRLENRVRALQERARRLRLREAEAQAARSAPPPPEPHQPPS